MDQPGHIIFLNGASSSGKSTLANALQAVLPLPFWHLSIDHIREAGVLPDARIRSGEFAWRDMRGAFFAGFHASLEGFAQAGNNLIVEHVLDTAQMRAEVTDRLARFEPFYVGLHTPLSELTLREIARQDRPEGSAAADFTRVQVGLTYDLEVDGTEAPQANATRILQAWQHRRRGAVRPPA